MARKHTPSDDIAEIEREIGKLMHDLETRVGRLNTLTRKSATQAVHGAKRAANGAGDYVSDTLADAAERLRSSASAAIERAHNGASNASDEASRISSDAMHRIEDEIGHRPLLTLAIAAGIGFLAGIAGRRQ